MIDSRCPYCGNGLHLSLGNVLPPGRSDRFSSGRVDCAYCRRALYIPYHWSFVACGSAIAVPVLLAHYALPDWPAQIGLILVPFIGVPLLVLLNLLFIGLGGKLVAAGPFADGLSHTPDLNPFRIKPYVSASIVLALVAVTIYFALR